MFSRERIERFDASHGIPRKANEQYLPSYNAFWHWAKDIGRGSFYVILGFIEVGMCLLAGWLFGEPGLINLAFWAMAFCCLCGGFVDAYSLLKDYRVRHMSTAHGSARWAKAKDLVRCGLMNRIRGLPLPANSLPIAKAFGGRDVFLPPSQWLRRRRAMAKPSSEPKFTSSRITSGAFATTLASSEASEAASSTSSP